MAGKFSKGAYLAQLATVNKANRKSYIAAMKKTVEVIVLLLLLTVICVRQGKILGWQFRPQDSGAVQEEENSSSAPVSLEEARRIFPAASQLETLENGICEARDKGETLGFVLKSSPYSDKVVGFMGPTPLLIGLDDNLKIVRVLPLDNLETPDFFGLVESSGLLESWNGLTASQAATKEVEAVSGATFSSNAVIGTMQARMAVMGNVEQLAVKAKAKVSLLPDIAFGLLLVVSLAAFFRPGWFHGWRTALLVAAVLVMGVWQGRLLSLAQFMVWLVNGVPLPAQCLLAVLLALSLLLPVVFGKAYYCAWVCPLGAAQGLLGNLNKKHKFKLGVRLLHGLQLLRTAVLLATLLAIALGLGVDFASYEAFTVFRPHSAPIFALVLGVVSLVLSVWIQRPWCRFFCPLGELLETLRRGGRTSPRA